MRTSLLKRLTSGAMAVATATTLFVGMSFGVSAAPTPNDTLVLNTVTSAKTITSHTFDAATGKLEIVVGENFSVNDTIALNLSYIASKGTFLAGITGDQKTSAGASLGAASTVTITPLDTSTTIIGKKVQPKVSALTDTTSTGVVTLTAKGTITSGTTLYITLEPDQYIYATVFWSGVADRRVVTDVAAGNVINIYYNTDSPSTLLNIAGDTLPAVTIGRLTTAAYDAGKTLVTADTSADYNYASISKNGTVTLGGTTYTVNFITQKYADSQLNGTTWANPDLKAKMAYSVALTVGGATYTVDKSTAATDFNFTDSTLTYTKVTTATGAATVLFKGPYLYADQAFTMTAAELATGKTFTIVYKDNSTSDVTIKGNASGVVASSKGIYTTAPTATILIAGAANTAYPIVTTKDYSMTTVNLNLVNDVLPTTLQVKLASDYISGGSVTVDVKFYNQIFPILLTDGSYYYLSVNVSSLANNVLPVTKFNYIGVYNTNIDYTSLVTWNKDNASLNKILYVDFTGTMTDRTTTYGVTPDGVTAKVYPTSSYYASNNDWTKTDYFYAQWTEGTDLKGTTVRYTRPYVTFDITDAVSKNVATYSVVFVSAVQEIYSTATNSTLGGQAAVTVDPGLYKQTWKLDTAGQYIRDTATTTAGQFNITSYYTGTVDLATDYVMLTLRLPKACTLSMSTLATGDISAMTVVQSPAGNVGNTTIDGLVDYVVRFNYRELYTGSNNVGTSTLRVTYPMTNKDNTTLSTTAFKDYKIVTTWTAKAYIAEKKVTMAGITVPSAILDPTSDAASSVAASTATSTATSSKAAVTSTKTSIPTNPNTGVPFNTLAYVLTIAASAVGGVSTMVVRKKK